MNRRALLAIGALAVLLLVGLLLRPVIAPPAPPTPGAEEAPTAPELPVAPARAPTPPVPREPPPSAAGASTLGRVYVALEPGGMQIRCPVSTELAPGIYDAQPPRALHVVVRDEQLGALVQQPAGEVRLSTDLSPRAILRWQGASPDEVADCSVQPIEQVEIRGYLRSTEGEPVADHEVRGCLHGEFARTDAEGAWSLQAVDGSTCHPMAFVEAEAGGFGKSNVVDVEVRGPGPIEGVELVLPAPEELWGPEQQRELASRLGGMLAQQVETLREQRARTAASLASLQEPELRALAEELLAHQQRRIDWMQGELERLDRPEEQLAALRDAWLNLY